MTEGQLTVNRGLFRDRREAGQVLAGCLEMFKGKDAVVLGIPRGGVAVAREVADALNAQLDVIVARKLGSPVSPELAIGAVTANGGRFLSEEMIKEWNIPREYVESETERQRTEARRREAWLRASRSAVPLDGRVVIIVDDGLATGATMIAAVRSVRRRQPALVVAAVPVASAEACAALRHEADQLVCPLQPDPFYAVGLYYGNFDPVEDSEVQRILGGAVAEVQTGAGRS
jgi:putative phosphoribosyl transferase